MFRQVLSRLVPAMRTNFSSSSWSLSPVLSRSKLRSIAAKRRGDAGSPGHSSPVAPAKKAFMRESTALQKMQVITPAEEIQDGDDVIDPSIQSGLHKDLFEQMHKARAMQAAVGTPISTLTVRADAQTRIQNGHLWIYANDIIEALPTFTPGQVVHVKTKTGLALGTAYVNPRSLIAGRILSRRLEPVIDSAFFRRKFERALQLRQRFLPPADVRFCRLVHGEGDGVPGLVVDRFGDTLVVQAHTAGIDIHLNAAVAALQELLQPAVVVERSDVTAREHEGLAGRIRTIAGETDGRVEVSENGLKYVVDVLKGQKTGYFYDQREARRTVAEIVTRMANPKLRVLDLYCYTGSFALTAARAGASFSFGVDASPTAIEYAQINARTNGLGELVRFKKADVETVVAGMIEQKETYDVVICDPPALVKSSKKKFAGLRKMRQVHEQAMRVVSRGGVLVASSCDHLVPPQEFATLLAEAAARAGRTAQIIWRGFAGADHPVPLGATEPDYLCTFIMQLH